MKHISKIDFHLLKQPQTLLKKYDKESMQAITDTLLDANYKNNFNLQIFKDDNSDYNQFNDIEMIYLYVHQDKDLDEEKNTSYNTKKEYIRELIHVYLLLHNNRNQFGIPHSKNHLFKLLKEKHIRIYQQWLKTVPNGKNNKSYSVATISRKTTIFKSFLTFLYNKKYISNPLYKYFQTAKVGRKDRPNRDISQEEVIQLLQYYRSNPIVHGLLSLLVTTGARIQEICNAKVSDLTYERGLKSRKKQYWLEVKGKGGEYRSLLIHDNVFNSIIRFRQRRRLTTTIDLLDHSPLFTTAKGSAYHYKNLSMFLTKRINQAEVPFVQINNRLKELEKKGILPDKDKHKIRSLTPHTLRHGFAILSAENEGADIYRIMQSLGHKNIETTMIYLERRQSKENNVGHTWKNNEVLNFI